MSNQDSAETNEKDQLIGGCEGPDATYVKLVSSDGHEFFIRKVFFC
jgi:hypothetical protein